MRWFEMMIVYFVGKLADYWVVKTFLPTNQWCTIVLNLTTTRRVRRLFRGSLVATQTYQTI